MLPESYTLPDRMFEAKKILCPIGMEYEKIHACSNDCILYRKEFAELRSCPKCELTHNKVKDGDKENTNEVTKHDLPCCLVSTNHSKV